MASASNKPAKQESQPPKRAGSSGFRKVHDGKHIGLDPIAARLLVAQHTKSMSGPLPDSEEFAGYEQTLPGAADRIITMAEKEQEARLWENRERLRLDKKLITGFKWRTGFAQFAALTLVLAAFYVAYDLAMHDHDNVSGVIAGSTIGAILIAFLGSRGKKTSSSTEENAD